MNCQLLIRGENAGSFSLDELKQRRLDGRLTGQELVWREGMAGWEPLNAVLGLPAQPPKRPKFSRWALAGIVAGSIVLLTGLGFLACAGIAVFQGVRNGLAIPLSTIGPAMAPAGESGVAEASEPIQQNNNSPGAAQIAKKDKDFHNRQYLDAYQELGAHDQPWDAGAKLLIRDWMDDNYGGETQSNVANYITLGNKLAADPSCNDAIALTAAAATCPEYFEGVRRFKRAVEAFGHSHYKAYPQWFATVMLASRTGGDEERAGALEKDALRLFHLALKDGSLRAEDQGLVYDILISGWGEGFHKRHAKAICDIAAAAGESFQWLALMLKGRFEDDLAWTARGEGFGNTVTATGWQGFHDHTLAASNSIYQAWQLHPDWPEAAGFMVYVAIGEGGADGCRQWFDRTTVAQVDFAPAWHSMRWALRPRWYGSLAALRALGVSAIDSGRFDTDVPRKFFDCVSDIENELKLQPGEHIYGRADIWPEMKRMYEGYIAAPSQASDADGWRRAYAIVAYLGGQYAVSRQQLEKLDWSLPQTQLANWGRDLALLPLEVAARTGPDGAEVAKAEEDRGQDRIAEALAIYQKISASAADDLTRKFIQQRVAALSMEQRLAAGEWVDFLPASGGDLNWTAEIGSYTVQPGGAIDVKAGPRGSILVCHTRVGANFEIKGEMEAVHSTTKDFQGGIVAGMPELNYENWYALRLKRNANEGDAFTFSRGNRHDSSFSAPAGLNGDTNTFDFRLSGGNRVHVVVNGKALRLGSTGLGSIWLRQSESLAGFGSYNDMNETVIRYSKVQLRRIGAQ
ncbi:MAG TPA: DUF4339 domain-containing protein [Verrucomicrobiae bacterium]